MAKKPPPRREAAPLTVKLPANLKPAEDVTCGCYIRSLIVAGKSAGEILELVHKHFKGSTAKPSDVSWNRSKLKAAHVKVPDARRAAAPKVKKAKAKKMKAAKKPTPTAEESAAA
jgi:hypothetical protein